MFQDSYQAHFLISLQEGNIFFRSGAINPWWVQVVLWHDSADETPVSDGFHIKKYTL